MIEINNLTYSYSSGQVLAGQDSCNTTVNSNAVLKNVSIKFKPGKLYAILGNNGCGKSTLLKCIDGICKTQNVITVDGQKLEDISQNERAKTIAYCPQNSIANNLVVYDTIMLGRRPYITFSPSVEDKKQVKDAAVKFDLSALTDKPTNRLSGGEFQRVAIARCFAQASPILLLDEPTNNLDVKYQHVLMHHLQDGATEDNKTIICVLHDINMALTHADELIFMRDGNIMRQCCPNDVDKELFYEVYGVEAEVMDIRGYRAVFV